MDLCVGWRGWLCVWKFQKRTEPKVSLSLKLLFLIVRRRTFSSCHLQLVSSPPPPPNLFYSDCAGLYYTSPCFLYSNWSSNLQTLLSLTLLIMMVLSTDSPPLLIEDIQQTLLLLFLIPIPPTMSIPDVCFTLLIFIIWSSDHPFIMNIDYLALFCCLLSSIHLKKWGSL